MKHTFMAGGVDSIAMTVRERVKLDDGIRHREGDDLVVWALKHRRDPL